jgi:glycosyltransferase involved in cell wall biosynthesis
MSAAIGLIPEPPHDPRSWSGSALPFFRALTSAGAISQAREVALGPVRQRLEQLRAFSLPVEKWKALFHASVGRFDALSSCAAALAAGADTIQVGAWFQVRTPGRHFSYHDGNAAMWHRHYGRGSLSEKQVARHLAWERSVYDSMRGIFVMSSWLADSFVRDFHQPASKVHVVGAGVNLDTPEEIRRDWSVPRFLMVGRDFKRKGGDYLLEAFRKVRREVPAAELVLVGPTLSIEEPGVTCTGLLSKANPLEQAELDRLFRSATAVVLPSIYEPFGISLTEGMIYGLPCVTVNRCALPEIVQHGRTGLVAEPESADSLAAAMIELARNPAQCAQFGAAGRVRAIENFTWPAVAAKIKSVMDRKQ